MTEPISNTTTPKRNTTTSPSTLQASPVADKRAFAKRWLISPRTVDNFLAIGMPHLKIGTRRVRIEIEQADEWMRERYRVRRLKGQCCKAKANGGGAQ